MPATLPQRLGCSTISFQHLSLDDALAQIAELGFSEIDLGALPGVCDHVPFELDDAAIAAVTDSIRSSGLRVRSVNGDVGDLDAASFDRDARDAHLDRLLRLTAAVGAEALVLPCGHLGHDPLASLDADLDRIARELARAADRAADHGVAVWVESLHFLRLSFCRERADRLHALLEGTGVRPVLDVAHVTAAGDDLASVIRDWGADIAHVHLRDAVVGDYSRAIGDGAIDFAAALIELDRVGFDGELALELPSRAYVDDATGTMDAAGRAARADAVAQAAASIAPLVRA